MNHNLYFMNYNLCFIEEDGKKRREKCCPLSIGCKQVYMTLC